MTDDLDRLRLLHAVARTGSIAAAAREVGFTPSAVSQQLAALERRVGVALLERSNRGVTLTPSGTALAGRAVGLLDGLEAGLAEAVDLAGAPPLRPVRVAAFPTAITTVLLPALAGSRVGVPVTLVHLEPAAALTALLDRAVDLAVVDGYDVQPDPLPGPLVRDGLLHDALRLVHPSAWEGVDGLAALRERRWVLGAAASRLGRVSRMLCHLAGFEPRVVAETDEHHLAFRIAAEVGAATLQPGLAAPDLEADGALRVAGVDLGVVRRIDLVSRPLAHPDPALAAVVEAVRRQGG